MALVNKKAEVKTKAIKPTTTSALLRWFADTDS
jgi:hypothetical protein